MNIVLRENIDSSIVSLCKELKSKYPITSIINVNRENFKKSLEYLEVKPYLTKDWLVFIDIKLNIEYIIRILEKGHTNVMVCPNSDDFEDLQLELKERGIKFIRTDTTRPTQEEIHKYVMSNLNIDSLTADKLCKRHRWNVKMICKSVDLLSTFDIVTEDIIKIYTQQYLDASFSNITDLLLGVDVKVSKRKVCRLIYEYQNGVKFILNTVLSDIEDYMKVYDYILQGDLTIENYKKFKPEDNKEFKNISKYKLKKIILAFDYISYEKVLFMYRKVQEIKAKKSSLFRLIYLIGGN